MMTIFDMGVTHENLRKLCKAVNEQADEIERLQEALIAAKACINDKAYTAAIMVIDTALQQKESE